MADVRNTALGRNAKAVCECGWSLWRERGFTKKEAWEAVSRHHRHDCDLPGWREFRARSEAESW
jgi:hypothetical protein